MKDCRRIQDLLLTEYIDQRAGDPVNSVIEEHIHSCRECRAMLETLRRTHQFLASAPQPAPSEDSWSIIRARIEQAEGRSFQHQLEVWLDRLSGIWTPKAWAALAVIVILAGSLPLLTGTRTASPDETAALIAMTDEQDQTLFDDKIDLDTNTEYLLTTKGEVI